MSATGYDLLSAKSAALGLACSGGFHPVDEDAVPPLEDGRPTHTLVLMGFTGGRQWPIFAASPEFHDGKAEPLDRWSRRVAMELAHQTGGTAIFPITGPAWWPFQRWAQRAEGLSVSPLGLLIHPEFGLWHACRGALLFAGFLLVPAPLTAPAPCVACLSKPCLTACPAGAVTLAGFRAETCAQLLREPSGKPCLEQAVEEGRSHPPEAEMSRALVVLDANRVQAIRLRHGGHSASGIELRQQEAAENWLIYRLEQLELGVHAGRERGAEQERGLARGGHEVD